MNSNNGIFAVFGKNRHYFGKNCGKNRINTSTTAIHRKDPHRLKYLRGVLLWMKPQSIGIRFPILLPKTNSIKSATLASQRLCICFAAERYRASIRARKLAVKKSKRLTLLHILKREKYFPNPIPHQQVGTREIIPSK